MSGNICASLAKRKSSAGRNISRTLPPSASPVSSRLGLLCEKGTLALDAAGIAGQRPVRADHAMTGDCHGDAVRGAGPRHRAHSLRLPDGFGDLRIACRRADRDTAKRVPHAMLKRCSADVQGKVEADAWVLDEADHFDNEFLESGIVADQLRTRELLLEVARKVLSFVTEENGANALVACGNEHQAERALANCKPDLRIETARAELAWLHAEHLGGGRIEAAIGIKACTIDRLRHGRAARKLFAHALVAVRSGVSLRCHTERRLEDAMEVIRT